MNRLQSAQMIDIREVPLNLFMRGADKYARQKAQEWVTQAHEEREAAKAAAEAAAKGGAKRGAQAAGGDKANEEALNREKAAEERTNQQRKQQAQADEQNAKKGSGLREPLLSGAREKTDHRNGCLKALSCVRHQFGCSHGR